MMISNSFRTFNLNVFKQYNNYLLLSHFVFGFICSILCFITISDLFSKTFSAHYYELKGGKSAMNMQQFALNGQVFITIECFNTFKGSKCMKEEKLIFFNEFFCTYCPEGANRDFNDIKIHTWMYCVFMVSFNCI